MKGVQEREGYERELLFPPSTPRRAAIETYHPESKIWDTDIALDRLVNLFSSPDHRDAIKECAGIVERQSKGRWQLGYQAVLSYSPDGELHVRYPTRRELNRHNRYRHQLGVAYEAASLAQKLRFPSGDVFIAALAGEIHDYDHTIFSHAGEKTFQAVYEELVKDNPNIGKVIEEAGFNKSHEDRLRNIIFDPKHPLGGFLRSSLSTDALQKLARTGDEEGDLGLLLKLSDTTQYLNMDSIFFGLEPPHFERYLPQALRLEPFGLAVADQEGADILARMLTYRGHMWRFQYEHPFNNAMLRMQIVALGKYFFDDKKGINKLSGFQQLMDGMFTADEALLEAIRRKTLSGDLPTGIAFFGTIFPNVRIGEFDGSRSTQIRISTNGEFRGKFLIVKTPIGVEVAIAAGKIDDLPENALVSNGMVFQGTGDPFEDAEKVLAKICTDDLFVYGPIDGLSFTALRNFSKSSPREKLRHPDRPKVDRFFNSDFQIVYNLSDVVHRV